MYNALFFFLSEMEVIFAILQFQVFFLLIAVMATVPVMIYEEGSLREVLSKTIKRFFKLMLTATAAVLILLLTVYLGRIVIVTLIFGFALAAIAQKTLYLRLLGQPDKKK